MTSTKNGLTFHLKTGNMSFNFLKNFDFISQIWSEIWSERRDNKVLKCQARRRKRTSARPKFTVTNDLHIFVPIVILFQKFKCCFILENQTPQLTQPFSNSKDILWYKNIVNIYVLINLYQSIVVNHTYLKDWNIPTTCIILYGFVANLRRQQLELLPTIAYYCLLLPTIANFCQLLPTIAYYCQLLPTIA